MEPSTTIEGAVEGGRANLKQFAQQILNLKDAFSQSPEIVNEDRGEVMANLTLAYRHIEDATMRLGKVLQARNGGVSIYDKPVGADLSTGSANIPSPK